MHFIGLVAMNIQSSYTYHTTCFQMQVYSTELICMQTFQILT